jgi:hypothetical protein
MEKSIITPHASQPRIVLATFKCNTTTSDFPRRPQCLVPPTALSTSRRWNTPRDVAANWCQRFEFRVWPRQRLLANDLQANHNSIFFYCAEMLRTLLISDILPPKTKSELKEMRNDFLFFRATVLYLPRNWCPLLHWRIDHPRHFWL